MTTCAIAYLHFKFKFFQRMLFKPLLAVSTIISLVISPLNANERVLSFAYEMKPNPPYYLGEGESVDMQYPGVTLEVLSLVAKQLGFKVEYQRVPWAWGLKLLKSNQIDGLFHASFKEKRMEIGAYPMLEGGVDAQRSIMSQRYILYKNKTSPVAFNGKGFDQLNGKIGVINGYSIVDDLEKMGVDIYKNSHISSSMNMLLKDRVVGVVDLEYMGDAFLRTQGAKFSNIVKTSPPIVHKPYYLMLSHGFVEEQANTAEKIWDAIAAIKKTGEYLAIVKKYDHILNQ